MTEPVCIGAALNDTVRGTKKFHIAGDERLGPTPAVFDTQQQQLALVSTAGVAFPFKQPVHVLGRDGFEEADSDKLPLGISTTAVHISRKQAKISLIPQQPGLTSSYTPTNPTKGDASTSTETSAGDTDDNGPVVAELEDLSGAQNPTTLIYAGGGSTKLVIGTPRMVSLETAYSSGHKRFLPPRGRLGSYCGGGCWHGGCYGWC